MRRDQEPPRDGRILIECTWSFPDGHLATERIQLVDAVVEIVRDIQDIQRVDPHGAGESETFLILIGLDHTDQVTRCVEYLNASILGIRHDQISRPIQQDAPWLLEFEVTHTLASEGRDGFEARHLAAETTGSRHRPNDRLSGGLDRVRMLAESRHRCR